MPKLKLILSIDERWLLIKKAKAEFRKNRNQYILLAIAIAVAAVLRLYRSTDLFMFDDDQAEDAFRIWRLINEGKIYLVGTDTSLGTSVPTGPFYYYLITPLYYLSKGNPVAVSIILKALSVGSVILFFIVVSKFHGRTAGLIAAWIDAISYNGLEVYRWLSNPMPLMLFGLIFVWILYEIVRKKERKFLWVLAWFVVGISLHLEAASAIFYIPVLLLFTVLQKDRLPGYKVYLMGVVAFLITLTPQIIFNIQNDGTLVRTVFGYIFTEEAFIVGLSDIAYNLKNTLYVLSFWIFPQDWKAIGVATFLLFPVFFFRLGRKKDLKYFRLLIIIIAGCLVGFTFYRYQLYDYYLTGFYASYVISLSTIMGRLVDRKDINVKNVGRMVSLFLTIAIFTLNGVMVYKFLTSPKKPYNEGGYVEQLEAIDWMLAEAKNSRFYVTASLPAKKGQSRTVREEVFIYLTTWQAREKCHIYKCRYEPVKSEADLIFFLYNDVYKEKTETDGNFVTYTRIGELNLEKRSGKSF